MAYATVSGAEEVIKFLEEISSEKQAQRVSKILAERTADKAYQLAPEDTGKMEDSIQVKKTADGEYEVVCTIPYAIFNEFGTFFMPVGTEDSPLAVTSTSGKAAYRPFMRPAAYQTLDELQSIINQVFFGRVVSLGDE